MATKADQRPYLRLWRAVLVQAVRDLRTRKTGTIPKGTYAWFTSADQDLGSYLWICWVLGIDPACLREQTFKALEYIPDPKQWKGVAKALVDRCIPEEDGDTSVPSWWKEF